jgi:hypothetical protein
LEVIKTVPANFEFTGFCRAVYYGVAERYGNLIQKRIARLAEQPCTHVKGRDFSFKFKLLMKGGRESIRGNIFLSFVKSNADGTGTQIKIFEIVAFKGLQTTPRRANLGAAHACDMQHPKSHGHHHHLWTFMDIRRHLGSPSNA